MFVHACKTATRLFIFRFFLCSVSVRFSVCFFGIEKVGDDAAAECENFSRLSDLILFHQRTSEAMEELTMNVGFWMRCVWRKLCREDEREGTRGR